MITLLLFLLLPIAWGAVVKFVLKKSITWLEMFVMIGVTAVIMTGVYFSGVYSEMADTQLMNGLVTGKQRNEVSCRHSYRCHCHTVTRGSGSNRHTTTECDTCYEHRYDVDWDVYSTIGSWGINTIDRQGLREPPRWTQVMKNDPVSRTSMYQNYVKAVPESLFHFDKNVVAKYAGKIPAEPMNVYDYYKVDRLMTMGVSVPDAAQWNHDMSTILGELGPSKQVNGVIMITSIADPMYAKAVQASWLGGKKNDTVLIIGAPHYPEIEWVRVFSWSKEDIFNVKLRDDVLDLKTVKRETVLGVWRDDIAKYYKRRPMEDYAYLKNQVEPPQWAVITALILAVLSLGGLTFWFHQIDLYEELFGSGYGYRRRKFFR